MFRSSLEERKFPLIMIPHILSSSHCVGPLLIKSHMKQVRACKIPFPISNSALELAEMISLFWINLPAVSIPLVVLFLIFHLREEQKRFLEQIISMDWLGIFLLSTALITTLYALFAGGDALPWNSASIISLLILGPTFFTLFVLHEAFIAGKYLRPKALVPLRIFANRTAASGYIVVIIHAIVLATLANYYPLYVSYNHLD